MPALRSYAVPAFARNDCRDVGMFLFGRLCWAKRVCARDDVLPNRLAGVDHPFDLSCFEAKSDRQTPWQNLPYPEFGDRGGSDFATAKPSESAAACAGTG